MQDAPSEPPYDPTDPEGDPFHPPSIPTLVECLHCGEEYESFLIEWRIEPDGEGGQHGFWCCPTDGCDGKGFGFDLLPIDPEWTDPDGREMGWSDDGDEDEESADIADWTPDDDDADDDEWGGGTGLLPPPGDEPF